MESNRILIDKRTGEYRELYKGDRVVTKKSIEYLRARKERKRLYR